MCDVHTPASHIQHPTSHIAHHGLQGYPMMQQFVGKELWLRLSALESHHGQGSHVLERRQTPAVVSQAMSF
jgi:hypothetical protein